MRRKRVQVSSDLIREWLRAEREHTFADVKAQGGTVACIQDKLPKDAEVVHATALPNGNIEITFESAEFEVLQENEAVPLITPTFQVNIPTK